MATKAQVKAFIERMAPIAVAQAAKHGNKVYPSVCIAQACCESQYGTAPKMVNANAVFGIKVGNSKAHFGTAWKDKAYSTKTKECYDGKTYVQINDMFRAYDSIEEATEDYFDMLCTSKRYAAALNQPTPQKCIEGIQKAPYATAPNYTSTIMSIIRTNNLTQYDTGTPVSVVNKITNPYPEPQTILKKGARGDTVKWIQYALNCKGYSLAVDGIWGRLTQDAVIDFQRNQGLISDGLVGVATRTALEKL